MEPPDARPGTAVPTTPPPPPASPSGGDTPPPTSPWRTASDEPPIHAPAGEGVTRREAVAPRERAFNAPAPVVLWSALLILAFLGQLAIGLEPAIRRFGLIPIELSAGRVTGLISHIGLHGGWLHLFLNTTALLAFGAPVARLFGADLSGLVRFSAYFLVCGLLGGLTFWALHPQGAVPLVGASGAISGLMGGAARLIERRGVLGGAFSRAALGFVVPWIVLNLLIALAGAALGPAVPIAWEAHLGGLAAGLLLLGVFAPRRR